MPRGVYEALRAPGQPLDPATQSLMESCFGRDFSRVRVHTDPRAAESAETMSARAYTVDQDIVFGVGELAPQTLEGRKLLAHELTHVAQQERCNESPSFPGAAEAEARSNSYRVLVGRPAQVDSSASAGAPQRQDKPSGGLSTDRGFTTTPKKATNKFAFDATVTVPLRGNRLGPFSILKDLKLTNKASKETEEPIPMSFTGLSSMQTSAALKLVSLEVPPLKLPKSLGKLNLAGSLAGAGGTKLTFGDEGAFTQDLSATASLDASYKSPSLLSPQFGNLTVGSTLGGKGTLQEKFGGATPGFTPSASAGFSLEAKYLSRPTSSPFTTFAGILGDKGQLSLGVKGEIDAAISGEKGETVKPSGSLELGLLGEKRKGIQPFVTVKVSGEAEIDLQNGGIKEASKSVSAGVTTGIRF